MSDAGLFDQPWALLGLLALPLLAALLIARRRERRAPLLFSRATLWRHLPRGPRAWLAPLPALLHLLAIALLILAAARPTRKTAEEAQVEGIDIYVALDLSGSMQAVDVDDQTLRDLQARGREPDNRFDIARDVLADFVRSRRVDRIGMVVFARDAFLQFPLTLDYNTILTQLDNLELGDIDGAGTAIGNALGRAVAGLQHSDARTRIIVLITDGDRRGGNISPMQAASFAKELNIPIFPILIGQEGKSRIPVGRNLLTNQLSYRLQDYPVDPKLLQQLAEETGGTFYRAVDRKDLEQNIHKILDGFEKSRIKDAADVNREELFPGLVAAALALLVAAHLLRYTVLKPFP